MARPYRIQFEGATSLVSVRGLDDNELFKDRADFERVVKIVGDTADKHAVVLHTFCATSNRIDMLITTPNGNTSSFLQGFQTSYAQYYRQRYKTKGTLVRDRFRSRVVDSAYMLQVSRKVHLLPVELAGDDLTPAAKRKLLKAHKWSSYATYIGEGKPLEFVEARSVLKQLPGSAAAKPAKYKAYVEDGLENGDEELLAAEKRSVLAIGSEAYVDKIVKDHDRFVRGKKPAYITVYGKRSGGVARNKVLDAVCKGLNVDRALLFQQRKNVLYRPTASFMLYRHSRMSQDQIADLLQLSSGAAVSLQIRRVRDARNEDPEFRKKLERIDRMIAKTP